jgi:hypothetical protein
MEEKSKNTFYLDPDYENFIPRKSRLKYETVGKGYLFVAGMLVLVAFFGCMAAAFIYIAYIGVRDFWQFNINGVETLATVGNCEIEGDGTKYERLRLTYSYTVANIVYDARDSIPTKYANCEQFLTGNQVSIQYYNHNPAMSRIEEHPQWSHVIFGEPIILLCAIPLFSIISLLGAGSIVIEFQARYQHRLLRREGILLYGEVVTAEYEKGQTGSGNSYTLKITAEFETPDGRLISRVFEGKTENFISRVLPQPGTPVQLLYANDHAVIML